MNDDKTKSDLEQIFSAGEAWLRKYGFVKNNKIVHNNIVLNLYVHFPKLKYHEYFIPTQEATREIKLILYFPTWYLIFKNKDKIIDQAMDLVREYLNDYTVTVELKRYKPSVKNEVNAE